MPIYEYLCSKCGTFEQIQKVSDPILKKCPTCRRKVTKKISTPALHFKGEGFWVTDYGWKSKNQEGRPSSEAGPPGSGDGSSDGSSAGTKEASATESSAKENVSKAGGATEGAPTSAPSRRSDSAKRPKSSKAAKG